MAPSDPRAPVLVGAAQVLQRDVPDDAAREPLALLEEAARLAAEDAQAPALLAAADSIRVTQGVWRYANPAAWLAERLGAPAAQTALGPVNGSMVQRMLSHAACEIRAGRRDVVLLASAECERSRRRASRAGRRVAWTAQKGPPPDETFASKHPDFGRVEVQYRFGAPPGFAFYENALRHHAGRTPEAHARHISELWAGFSQVAARNPHAWLRTPLSAEAIRTPGPDNRMIAYPYTKTLCANMVVDMAAALVLCSAEAARRHGVPESRWIYPHAATDVLGSLPLGERVGYHEAPAIGHGGGRALALAGADVADLDAVDLYSCFPAAVQLSAQALGLPLSRPLTVTGGLTFAGGPLNSYVMHSIATMVTRLRGRPGARGLVTSLGGYVAKHAFCVYGADPPPAGFRYEDCTDAVLAQPRRRHLEAYEGNVTIETFTQLSPPGAVGPGRPGPEGLAPGGLLVAGLTQDGARVFALHDDAATLAALAREELCGREGRVRDGRLLLA